MRNAEDGMDKWYEQLNDLVKKCKQTWSVPEVSFSLSVYENNSEDKTVEKLKSYDFSQFEQNKINAQTNKLEAGVSLVCESLAEDDPLSKWFQGDVSEGRLRNLANARNRSLEAFDLNCFDKVISVEVDILYNPNEMEELIWASIPYDILSPMSMMSNRPDVIYDSWAFRITENCENVYGVYGTQCEGQPFYIDKKIVYSTYMGFCIYNPEALVKCQEEFGECFGYVNPRHEHSVGPTHWTEDRLECDTVVICEYFHKLGYKKIGVDFTKKAFHR